MSFKYILKKIITNFVVLMIVVTLNFFLPRLIFSDPAQPYYIGLPEDAIKERALVRAEHGFDKPLIVQYFTYLSNVFTLNFGMSHAYKESVFDVMFKRIPWSLFLNITSLVISLFLGILFGAIASKKRGKWQDNTLLKLSTVSTAIPSFWIALMSVVLFAFIIPIFPHGGALQPGYKLTFNYIPFVVIISISIILTIVLYKVFKKGVLVYTIPLAGLFLATVFSISPMDLIDILYHSILPLFVIISGGIISYSLSVRNNMINIVGKEYIFAARAKGLPQRVVLYKHTFRNALLPLVTSLGMSFVGLFGGSVLIEKIFSWPGMGKLMIEANNNGDFQLAQAILLFFAIITIIANFITDLIYHKLDPRIGENV